MKRGAVLLLLLILGCSQVTTPPPNTKTRVVSLTAASAPIAWLLSSGLTDSLSDNLGWGDYDHSYLLSFDQQRQALVIPLEAADELRFLVCLETDNLPPLLTAVGWAETDWFSPARAETLGSFEGWQHFYDLRAGQRCLSRYYQGGVCQKQFDQFQPQALTIDLLAADRRFSWLSLQSHTPPPGLTPRLFLAIEPDSVIIMIAPQIQTLFALTEL